MKLALLLFIVILFGGCTEPDPVKTTPQPGNKAKANIIILPLDGIPLHSIAFLKEHIGRRLIPTLAVHATEKLPQSAYYAPGKRFMADTVLQFLKPFISNTQTYVLGVTGKDICTKKGENRYWGIMGLGYQPGQCCIISDYRLGKYPQTEFELNERLLKVALHELGHNFGLPHCPQKQCLMTDAEGKDKLKSEHDFCAKCTAYLHSKGLLKQPKEISNR